MNRCKGMYTVCMYVDTLSMSLFSCHCSCKRKAGKVVIVKVRNSRKCFTQNNSRGGEVDIYIVA